jgi:3-methyladenine DNA glycosylase AlkD
MNTAEIVRKLKSMRNEKNIRGMARFGINPNNTFGVSIPLLRNLAKKIGKNHTLALELWKTGIHEARLLAGFIGNPKLITENQMEAWVRDFDSWDVCDQVCSNLFDQTPFAWQKAAEWPHRKEEFVRRAGFVMMAALSVHDKNAKDEDFIKFFPLIKKYSTDERNFVRKAVNWALRQIGKRNQNLNKRALLLATELLKLESKSARWIASDAIRELKSQSIKNKLKRAKI